MNKEGFHNLSLLLERNLNLQNELLVLEKSKTKALVSGEISKIEEILKEEQTFLFKCDAEAKHYQALLKEMRLGGLSLKQIVQEYDPHNHYSLKSTSQDLQFVVGRLKVTNQTNQKIIQSRLSVISQCLSLVGLRENALTYNKDGCF